MLGSEQDLNPHVYRLTGQLEALARVECWPSQSQGTLNSSSWLWVFIRPGGPRLALADPSRAQSPEQLHPAQWLSSQPGLGKALFTLEGSTSFVTVTHCCWEPKNTFINGKTGLAPQSNILPSVEELAGGSECILGKYGFLSSRGPWGGSTLLNEVPAHLCVAPPSNNILG